MVKLFDLPAHLLEFSIKSVISIVDLKGVPTVDGESFSRRGIMIGIGALHPLLSLFRGYGPTHQGRLSLFSFLMLQ